MNVATKPAEPAGIEAVERVVFKPAEWHAERARGVGSSDVAKIMSGDWFGLWQQKTGRAEPEDLSDVLPVIIGAWTEPLNAFVFWRRTGLLPEACVRQTHPAHPFLIAEGDYQIEEYVPGAAGSNLAGVECKHVNAFAKDDEVVSRYWWQCQHQMAVYGWPVVYLSVLFGTQKWERFQVDRDDDAIGEMIETCSRFWSHVESDMPPENFDGETVTVSLDDMREVDMAGNNAWSAFAVDWLENKKPAKVFKDAETELKGLVEPDVKRAFGAGIEINRSKNGALRIKETKNGS